MHEHATHMQNVALGAFFQLRVPPLEQRQPEQQRSKPAYEIICRAEDIAS